MTVAHLKIGRQEYVVIPKREFDRMRSELDAEETQDRADVVEAVKRLKDPRQRSIPWREAKKRLGIA